MRFTNDQEARVKILVVDHNAVLAEDRSIYRRLQANHGFDVLVLVPERWSGISGETRCEPEPTPVRVATSNVLFTGKSHRVMYPGLTATLRSFSPDIIFVNAEPEAFLAFQAVVLRRIVVPRAKLVAESWRNMPYTTRTFPVKWPWLSAAIERGVVPALDGCIVHCRKGEGIFTAMQVRNVRYVPASVDTSLFKPRASGSSLDTGPKQVFDVGFVGRLVPEKGVGVLLNALSTLSNPWRLTVVGDGSEKANLQKEASRLGVSEAIVWLPTIPHPLLPEAMARFDVLVLPSTSRPGWSEQFGRVLIEAMACGVAVVGSQSGEIASVIGEAGVTFPEGDSVALAACLRDLWANSERRKECVRRGFERVKDQYSSEVVAEKYAEFFRDLAHFR
jgi:L-malate glycosyltransferase